MVLCDSLIYNTPGTLTIEVVAYEDEDHYYDGNGDSYGYQLKSETYAFSQAAFQDACAYSGADMPNVLRDCFFWVATMLELYESYGSAMATGAPHWYRIVKTVSEHVTATRDGEACDVATAMWEYSNMGGESYGYWTHTYVFTFDRMGLRKDDIANAEDWFYLLYEVHVDGTTLVTILYFLSLLGFMDPAEVYQLLSIL